MTRVSQTLSYLCVFVLHIVSTTSLNIVNHKKTSTSLKAINWGMPLAGHKLDIAPLATETAKNRFQCISKCTKTRGCISINVGPKVGEEHVCELLGQDRYIMALNMTVAADWTYIGIKTKCDKNPCGSKMCVPDYMNDNYNCIGQEDTNCKDLLDKGIVSSGLLLVYLVDRYTQVYCDQETDSGGWLVIQRKEKIADFDKTWEEYKNGFGNLTKSFWWGNEKIHQITSAREYDLRIDLTKNSVASGYGKYTQFKLSSEQDNYRLHLNATGFTGTIGDSLTQTNVDGHLIGKEFTTTDRDHDTCACNCATLGGGGWWFGHCGIGVLNTNAFDWRTWSNYQHTVLSEMMIRPAV